MGAAQKEDEILIGTPGPPRTAEGSAGTANGRARREMIMSVPNSVPRIHGSAMIQKTSLDPCKMDNPAGDPDHETPQAALIVVISSSSLPSPVV